MLTRTKLFFASLPRDLVRVFVIIVALFLFLFLPVGMIWVNEIDDNLDFGVVQPLPHGKSRAVEVAVKLIDREVNQNGWTPNDPFFLPGAWLDRMPAYQAGIVSALSRFAIEMGDQIGRTRGSSQIDRDLDKAAGLLKYPPDIWIFDFSTSLIPTASSHKQYRSAMRALENYNSRLMDGEAVFESRADNLQNMIERFTLDLGSASAAIANRIDKRGWYDTGADEVYYDVKGRMYAYYLLMRALRQDFRQVIAEKQLEGAWLQTEESLAQGALLDNFFIFNNAPDSQFLPQNLAPMGFYLLRARTQMEELSAILLR